MKRFISVLMILMLLLCSVSALAESWTCPNCGNDSQGNFCMNCGSPKPEESTTWICPNCGQENEGNFCFNCGAQKPGAKTAEITRGAGDLIRLDLDIGFEENSVSSRYDAKLLIDDEYVETLIHGKPYKGSLELPSGSHTIEFQKDSNSSVNGTKIFLLEEPTLFACVIHAKFDQVEITGVRTTTINADDPLPGEGPVYVNGDLNLKVRIEFERNITFSKYDVDMYMDGIYVATLPHGNDFEGALGVSKGEHVLTFYKAGGKTVSGTSKFTVSRDSEYSCKIEATSSKVKVSKEKIK